MRRANSSVRHWSSIPTWLDGMVTMTQKILGTSIYAYISRFIPELLFDIRNWSFGKRSFTTFSISFLTFSVYIGSAIYTPAIPGLMEAFDISLTKATLGLTLYV